MKNQTRWLVLGTLFLMFAAGCSSPTNPRFPDKEEEDDRETPGDGDEQAFLDMRFSGEGILL